MTCSFYTKGALDTRFTIVNEDGDTLLRTSTGGEFSNAMLRFVPEPGTSGRHYLFIDTPEMTFSISEYRLYASCSPESGPYIRMLYPEGGESFTAGESVLVRFEYAETSGWLLALSYSISGASGPWFTMAAAISGDTYRIGIPDFGSRLTDCYLRICVMGLGVCDQNDAPFTINTLTGIDEGYIDEEENSRFISPNPFTGRLEIKGSDPLVYNLSGKMIETVQSRYSDGFCTIIMPVLLLMACILSGILTKIKNISKKGSLFTLIIYKFWEAIKIHSFIFFYCSFFAWCLI
jgi:hypothetical protein